MDAENCRRYLAGIEYDLTSAKKEGLHHFYKLLIDRGEVPAQALPVRYCGSSVLQETFQDIGITNDAVPG